MSSLPARFIALALFAGLSPLARPDDRLKEPLAADPMVRTGRLDNGLVWMFRENAKPKGKVDIRLVIHAGSALEADDQQGLAHLLEHMAFNGSRNFKKQEVIAFLESLGVAYGPELNAYTDFNDTVYQLQLPSRDRKELDQGFRVLADWAAGLVLAEDEIDKERKVVREEWRSGRDAEERLWDIHYPVLLQHSRYADRLPIGKMEVIETTPARRVRDFYRDWYRPDLMTLILVGDLPEKDALELIRKHFGPLANPPNPPPRPELPVPGHKKPLVSVADDPEATDTTVELIWKMPARETATVGSYRARLAEDLACFMLSNRLDEVAQQPDAPFQEAEAFKGTMLKGLEVFWVSAAAPDAGGADALEGLLLELERVKRHGFTDEELARAKKDFMSSMESAWRGRKTDPSSELIEGLAEAVILGRTDPGLDAELKMHREFLPGIKRAETEKALRSWLRPDGQVVLLSGPRKEGAALPPREQVRALLAKAPKTPVEPWKGETIPDRLMDRPEKPGSVVAREEIPELGITIATLSNGVKVWLKPTGFDEDEVLLRAFSPGGLSKAAPSKFVSAAFADELVARSGLGNFSRTDLEKVLAGRLASVNTHLEPYHETLDGASTPQDLEVLFQLVHLAFTAPRKDPQALETIQRDAESELRNRLLSPLAWFDDRAVQILYRNHALYRSLRLDELPALALDDALEFHRQRFADADDFTFVLCGNFEMDKALELAAAYLAPLPCLPGSERWVDPGVRLPAARSMHAVEKGIEPLARVRMCYTGPLGEYSPERLHRIQSLTGALDRQIADVIREKLGGTYDIRVFCELMAEPVPQYDITIDFGCAPQRVDELVREVRKIVAEAGESSMPRAILERVQEVQRSGRATALATNAFWIEHLSHALQTGIPPRSVLGFDERVRSLSRGELRDLARELLLPERETLLLLRPDPSPVTP